MKIYISRHGEASFNASSDRERPLTPVGVEQTKLLLKTHLSDLSAIDAIWSSDLERAKETAAIYADQLKLSVEEKRFLAPDDEPKTVLRHLQSLGADAQLLIVSHQPLVGELVSFLCEGNVYQSHPYTTSEIVVVECEMPEKGLGTKVANFIPS